MKFTLTHVDLDKAVRAYIRGLMTISEDTMITVDVRSSKGETITEVNLYSPDENGNYDIPEAAPAVAKAAPAPAPVADGEAPKRRGRPPKAAPVEETAPVSAEPETAEEYEEEPTEEDTEEVEETAPVAATPAPAPVAAPVAQSQAPVSAAVPPKRTPLFGARKAG